MNAIEYFKSYGLSESKRILRDARGCASVRLYDKYNFSTDDLKQIVDAFELVGSKGNLRLAHNFMQSEKFKSYSRDDRDNFEKAINLVEQCQ